MVELCKSSNVRFTAFMLSQRYSPVCFVLGNSKGTKFGIIFLCDRKGKLISFLVPVSDFRHISLGRKGWLAQIICQTLFFCENWFEMLAFIERKLCLGMFMYESKRDCLLLRILFFICTGKMYVMTLVLIKQMVIGISLYKPYSYLCMKLWAKNAFVIMGLGHTDRHLWSVNCAPVDQLVEWKLI